MHILEFIMSRVAIIYKAHTPAATDLAQVLSDWLEDNSHHAGLHQAGGPDNGRGPDTKIEFGEKPDLVVVLGGDGTVLSAVRAVVEQGLSDMPVLGVNLGGLGFLTAVGSDELLPAMDKILAGDYTCPPRLMLKARVQREGEMVAEYTAFNDVVINKAALARIVELAVAVDGRALTTFRADGLIFSTPTGSTAYNLSSGGPICHPALDCIIITPIASFALSNRPLLVQASSKLELTLDRRAPEVCLTCDGQVGMDLQPFDRVTISRSESTVRLIHSPFKDYFEILRTKLRWG